MDICLNVRMYRNVQLTVYCITDNHILLFLDLLRCSTQINVNMHSLHRQHGCIMDFKASVSIILFFLGYHFCLSLESCTRRADVFRIEPEDVKANEGGEVSFACAPENFSLGVYSIIWTLHPTSLPARLARAVQNMGGLFSVSRNLACMFCCPR